jgi:N-methylhydantoinase A
VARARHGLRRPSSAGASRLTGPTLRIGVDVGGTFTDLALLDGEGRLQQLKVPSTPDDPGLAVLDAVEAAAKALGVTLGDLLERTRLFAHGTTVGTNALLTRAGPVVGMLCTEGFRDTLAQRRGHRDDVWAFRTADPPPLVPRRLRWPVRERVGPDGAVLTPLAEADVRAACARFRDEGVEAVAIGFLFGYVEPAHERRAAEIVAAEMPGAFVTSSHEVAPSIGEYERVATTAVNAYLGPAVARYLGELSRRMLAGGLARPPLIARSNGGLADLAACQQLPASLALSGPAAGMAAARAFSEWLGEPNLISADMGGTSFDVGVIAGGVLGLRVDTTLAGQHIALPQADVHSIGTGGGSIARVDAGGLLRVGPDGAGARPGPACYGHGGERATVTDANVVLGRVSPSATLPGGLRLDAALAESAIEREVAAPLGLDVPTAARGICAVATAQMADAIRVMTVERGLDPRGFVLLAAGGAAAQHASEIARALGIGRFYVPRSASVFCALGLLAAEPTADLVAPAPGMLEPLDAAALAAVVERLAEQARAEVDRHGEGRRVVVVASLDARYAGRHREFPLPLPLPVPADGAALRAEFDRLHRERFGHADPAATVEYLAVRVRARSVGEPLRLSPEPRPAGAPIAPGRSRPVAFAGAAEPTPIFDGDALAPGVSIEGPAVVEDRHTTTLLWPGDRLVVDHLRGYRVELA